MHCGNCNSRDIKSRKNYSHGKSSKAKTSRFCKECNSSNVIEEKKRFFRKRRF